MSVSAKNENKIQLLTIAAILTALVVILQYLGAFIKIGTWSLSLVLIPIVVGAAMCGPKAGAWLGFVFGVVVLLTDAGAFLAVNIPGTIITVLLKGTMCGWLAGLAYKFFEKKNTLLATIVAAIVCPIVNTGIFVACCFIFFFDTVKAWGGGSDVLSYVILVMIGVNFLVELGANILLSPAIVSILGVSKRLISHKKEG